MVPEYELWRQRLDDGETTTIYSSQDQPAPATRSVVTALAVQP